jgi:hypothetical protein
MTDLVERWPAEIVRLVLAGMTSGLEVADDVFTSPAKHRPRPSREPPPHHQSHPSSPPSDNSGPRAGQAEFTLSRVMP